MPKFALGWKRQEKDHRDWQYILPRRITATIPLVLDISSGLGPQLNQGALGSCGPNTSDELIEYDQKGESIPVVSASRLFIYWATRYLMGTVNSDSGVDNRTMLKALNQYGFPPESLWPYADDPVTYRRQPSQAAFQSAIPNKITSYAALAVDLSQMQGCIVTRFPFMFGFDVFQQIMSDQAAETGILTTPTFSSTPIGGHDVTICAYNASGNALPGVLPRNSFPSGYFKFRNHWMNDSSTPWGDGGYGYVKFDYATGSHASDFWVINAVPGGNPNPPAPPLPPPVPIPPIPVPPNPPVPPSPPIPPSPIPTGLIAILEWIAGQPWFQSFLQWLITRFQNKTPTTEYEWRAAVLQYLSDVDNGLVQS